MLDQLLNIDNVSVICQWFCAVVLCILCPRLPTIQRKGKGQDAGRWTERLAFYWPPIANEQGRSKQGMYSGTGYQSGEYTRTGMGKFNTRDCKWVL